MSPAARRLPAEWEPQSGILLTWPHDGGDFAPHLDRVEPVFLAIACAVARFESLWVVCRDEAHRERVAARLRGAGVPAPRLRMALAASDDCWARDHGPITVLEDHRPRLIDFRFNGWGGKFAASRDDRITAAIHAAGTFGPVELERESMVLEGGAIDSDGRGTLLTTRRCVLAPSRNPGLDRAAVEARLGARLGVRRVLWLEHGAMAGDDTDGHIDTLARFCNAHTIAYQACEDAADEHHTELTAMERELGALREPDGTPYRLIPLPLPQPVRDADGRRLAAGYANFLILNGAVLVPAYDDPADTVALERLAAAFPGREAVAVPCTPLLHQNGSLHCVTMQLPAGIEPAPQPEG